MFKALIFGDPHLSSRNISSRKDDYPETCLEKLTFIMKTAITNKVNCVIMPGDLYHHKEESMISRALDASIFTFIETLAKYHIDFIGVPGNHDMLFHNPDISKRPIGILHRANPTFYLVNEEPKIYEVKNGLSSFKVGISGTEFVFNGDKGVIANRLQYFPERLPVDYQIHVTHGSQIPFATSGDFKFMDFTSSKDIAAQNPAWDLNVNGHIHWVGEENLLLSFGKKHILNPGSLTRGSLKMENLKRGIFCFILTVQSVNGDIIPTFEKIAIPHRPAEEIFDVNEYLEGKVKDAKILEFIDQLKDCSLSTESSNSNIEKLIEEFNAPLEVKEKAKVFLNRLS